MSSFSRVPIVDVHADNIDKVWPSLILAMSNAAFIGIDTVSNMSVFRQAYIAHYD